MTVANNAAVRRAFEDAGLEFIEEEGRGVGVRLRTASPKSGAKKAR
jgi:hypothetical protein